MVMRKMQTVSGRVPLLEGTEIQGKWTSSNRETYWLMKLSEPG